MCGRMEAVLLEDIVTEAVESLDRRVRQRPHVVVAVGDDAVFHLRRCVASEGDQQDVIWLYVVLGDDIRVATSDCERLAGPSAGIDEIQSVRTLDELTLFRVRCRHRLTSVSSAGSSVARSVVL